MQVCVAVMRALCEGEDPPLQLDSIVEPDRATRTLLYLLEQGLDAAPRWLRAGVHAGADVLCVLLRCLATAGSSCVQPVGADRGESIFGSCISSFPASLSTDRQPRAGLGPVAEDASGAAEAVAEADREAVAARAASKQLVVEEGAAVLLVQLLGFGLAQCSTLRCIEVLACSADSSAAIAQEDGTAKAFTACLRSDNSYVQLAALSALAALGGQQASLQHLAELDSLVAALEDLAESPLQDVFAMATRVLVACEQHFQPL